MNLSISFSIQSACPQRDACLSRRSKILDSVSLSFTEALTEDRNFGKHDPTLQGFAPPYTRQCTLCQP